MRPRRRRAAVLTVLMRLAPLAPACALALGPVSASAQQQPDAYKRHMDNGVKLFADRNYPSAIVEFEAAYAANAKASPLINIALCHKAQFRYPKAIEVLETALTKHVDTMDEADRKAALDAINEMRALLGHVKITVTPAEAVLTVDGEKQSPEARKKPVPVAPGVHTVAASLNGYQTASQEVRVASGESKDVKLTLVKASEKAGSKEAPAGKPAPTRFSTPLMVTGAVLGGLGFLSLASGVAILSAKRLACSAELEAEDPTQGLCDDSRRVGTGVGLTVLGVVGLGVGVPMFIVGIGPPRKETPQSAAPQTARPHVLIGPTSGALRWSF